MYIYIPLSGPLDGPFEKPFYLLTTDRSSKTARLFHRRNILVDDRSRRVICILQETPTPPPTDEEKKTSEKRSSARGERVGGCEEACGHEEKIRTRRFQSNILIPTAPRNKSFVSGRVFYFYFFFLV